MNYKNYEEAVRRLAIPYMAKIDYQDIYHDCNDGEHFIDEDVNLLFSLIKEAEQLDTALDKACKMLSDLYGCHPLNKIDKDINCQKCTHDSKKCWRAHLMKGNK